MKLIVYALVPKKEVRIEETPIYAISTITKKIKAGFITISGTKKRFNNFNITAYGTELYNFLCESYECNMSDIEKIIYVHMSDYVPVLFRCDFMNRIRKEVFKCIINEKMRTLILTSKIYYRLKDFHISNIRSTYFYTRNYPCVYLKVNNVNSRLHYNDVGKYYVTTLLLDLEWN